MDFLSSLDTKVSDIEKPKDPPVGTYIWKVSKVPVPATSASGEYAIVEFLVQAVSAEEDVDPDDLEEFGAVAGIRSKVTFMAPTDADKKNEQEKALFNIKNFCLNILQAEGDDDSSLTEVMSGVAGLQFLGTLSLRHVEDNTYIEVKRPAPLD